MLMMDRITDNLPRKGGEHGQGHVVAEFDNTPDLWFFECHFPGNPIMPGCLGLDGLWQMTGSTSAGAAGRGGATLWGVGEVKLTAWCGPTGRC